MYLKIKGNIDMRILISDFSRNRPASKENLKNFFENGVDVVGYDYEKVIELYKEKARKFDMLHPKMNLNEDWVDGNISPNDLDNLFKKFTYPLDLINCELTIVDSYIFAKGTNINLFITILENYVKSKKVRFIRNSIHDEPIVKNTILNNLKNKNFNVRIEDSIDLHDRWWFSRKEGFTIGTSFNGLQKKDTTMKMLDADELNQIINKFGI